MALQINKTLDDGVVANYWKIIDYNYNVNNNKLEFYVELYLDNTSRLAGYRPIMVFNFQIYKFSNADMNTAIAGGNFQAGMYTVLKTLPQFLSSVDV